LDSIIGIVQRKENHGPEFTAALNDWARLGGKMTESAARLTHHGAQLVSESTSRASSKSATWLLAAACLAGLLIGVLLTLWITRRISSVLRTVIAELGQAASEVAGASSQIANSAQSLSQGASEQAAS